MSDIIDVRFYRRTVTNLSLLLPTQGGFESVVDPALGFKMYGVKDGLGAIQRFLVKGEAIQTTRIQPVTDTTSSFKITKADGATSILSVDSTNGRIGIGTITPAKTFDVAGDIKTATLQVTTGAGAGKILVSDASGNLSFSNTSPTSITGLLKGDGSAISAASDGTDYLSPSTGVTLAQGTAQTIGTTTNRVLKLWATDLTVTNAISGSVTGSAGTVTGLSVTAGKTLTVTNTLTLSGTDSSTLNIGTGGTLGTAAFTAATDYAAASHGHSSLKAADGSPDPAFYMDNQGDGHLNGVSVSLLYMDDTGTSANDNYIGGLLFRAKDDTNTLQNYASIQAYNKVAAGGGDLGTGALQIGINTYSGAKQAALFQSYGTNLYISLGTNDSLFLGDIGSQNGIMGRTIFGGDWNDWNEGLVQYKSSAAYVPTHSLTYNVGNETASAGTFVRGSPVFERKDAGTLTDDGILALIPYASQDIKSVGFGHIWASTQYGYSDHVHQANFTFDVQSMSIWNAVGSIADDDTDGFFCIYRDANGLVIKNRLGAKVNVGYSITMYDNPEITV